MQNALHHTLAGLRARIDALKEGRPAQVGLWTQAMARLSGAEDLPPLEALRALDRDLDRVGIHTAADAWLLRQVGAERGLAANVAKGLADRAQAAVAELEAAVAHSERTLLINKLPPGTVTSLEDAWPRAVRALKVADIFEAQAPNTDEPFSLLPPSPERRRPPPQSARVAIADFWARRAKDNAADVVQRRRDLDAAHEMLLRVGSESDREDVRRLRMEVSDARERVREAPPVQSLTELLRHVRRSATRDPSAAYRSLRGLYERAVEKGDEDLSRAAWDALSVFVSDGAALRSRLEAEDGRPRALKAAEPLPGATKEEDWEDRALLDVTLQLGERGLEAFELAAGCARYFDVEDALAEEVVSVEADKPRARQHRVPYPTERLEFELTAGFHEVRDFVIHDPRSVLLDVASGRQMVRAWIEEAPPPAPKKVRKTSVRVYVCDASGSMHGARARFRDAVLLAELNNLRTRARQGQPFDPLFFCFFNDAPTELVKVDGAASATRQLRKLLTASPAEGQTDITLALLQAFDSIRDSQGSDPYLARATVVLVTDGEDRVNLDILRQRRAPIDNVEIALSFIALGEENRDLKALAQEQRAQGGRAFYVHLSDKEILLARTEFDSRRRTLLPADLPVTKQVLHQLEPHLAALERIAEGGEVPQVPQPGAFNALFPRSVVDRADANAHRPAPRANTDPLVARLEDILGAIAEAAGLAPPDVRASECVVLLNHLLSLYGLKPPHYLELLEQTDHPPIVKAVERIRLLAGPLT